MSLRQRIKDFLGISTLATQIDQESTAIGRTVLKLANEVRSVDIRTARILQRLPEGAIQSTSYGYQTNDSESYPTTASTAFGRTAGDSESSSAYPHKLEEDFSRALRRYYEHRNRSEDAEVAYSDSPQTEDPQYSLGHQTLTNSGLANTNRGFSLAELGQQTGANTAVDSNFFGGRSGVYGMRDERGFSDAVAPNTEVRRDGLRTIEEI